MRFIPDRIVLGFGNQALAGLVEALLGEAHQQLVLELFRLQGRGQQQAGADRGGTQDAGNPGPPVHAAGQITAKALPTMASGRHGGAAEGPGERGHHQTSVRSAQC